MKLVLDITVLGEGHVMPKSRTGIFRYIENVAETLVTMQYPGLEIWFSAGSDLDSLERCKAYLATNPKLQSVPLIGHDLHWLLDRLLVTKAKALAKYTGYSLWHRIVKRFYWILDRQLTQDVILNTRFLSKMDVYHAMFKPAPAVVKSLPNLALVQTIYDLIPMLFPHYCEQGSVDLLHQLVDAIDERMVCLSISESTKRDLLDHKSIEPDLVHVTPLAASSKFHPCTDNRLRSEVRRKLSIPPGAYILSLSTLEPRKNIVSVIRAFDELIDRYGFPDLNLVLAGTKGWNYHDIFEHLHMKPETAKRVVVTGFVDDEDLSPLYSEASMFVYPSNYEGFGLPPLEAMQCGIPVITSNTSSLPEVMGSAGILVGPSDISAIAEAMRKIYTDSELAADLSRRSLKQAASFSWDSCTKLTIDAYQKALLLR